MSSDNVLQLRDLSYSYRSHWLRTKIDALKNVSLDVRSGECFGFLGHNGAGKTTTIKCILGLLKPTKGSVLLFGSTVGDSRLRENVGYLPEQPYFYDHLTVKETLKMYGELSGVTGRNLLLKIEQVFDRLKISSISHRRLRDLSKGQTQRIGLAQAIIHEPKLLILDEPFSGLDPIGRREFREIILEEKSRGTTIFMCTHVLSDVERMCARASILARGELKGVFTINDIESSGPANYRLLVPMKYIQSTNLFDSLVVKRESDSNASIDFATREEGERILRICLDAGIPIVEFQKEQTSLEDVFVKLVAQS